MRSAVTTVALLIIDDLGMRKLPHMAAAEDLLEIVMRRYERTSTSHLEPARRGLGQAARRYRGRHRDARSSAPSRARPHLRAAQLAHASPQRSDRVLSTQGTTGLLDHDRTR
jgi:hypothetical protein